MQAWPMVTVTWTQEGPPSGALHSGQRACGHPSPRLCTAQHVLLDESQLVLRGMPIVAT